MLGSMQYAVCELKFKGDLCNIPIDAADMCNTLPRTADSNGVVIVKFKRKLL